MQHSNILLVHLIKRNLGLLTFHEWECKLDINKLSTMYEIDTFLQNKCQANSK